MYPKEVKFSNGGSLIELSIKVDELIESLKSLEHQKGWVNLQIIKRKEPSEKGATHYVSVNTWKPTAKGETVDVSKDDSKDLPF
jgi:hypothetical protein